MARLFLALLLACPAVAAAADDPQVIVFETLARVAVGADGQPMEVRGSGDLPGPLREFVESSVRDWQFEPVVVDDEARQGTTWVRLSVCAVPRADGFALSSRYVGNGPGPAGGAAHVDPPQYPRDALHAGASGDMTVNYTVGTDGVATLDSIDYAQGEQKRMRRYFHRALGDWVRAMRYQPEELDGQPVATRISTPVSFRLDMPGTRAEFEQQIVGRWQDSPECLAAEGLQPQGQLLSAQSPFVFRDMDPAGP